MARTGSVRQTPNQRPVISVVRALMVVPYRLIRVSTQVLSLLAWSAMSVGVPMRSPRSLGRPRFPLDAGVGWWNTALLRALVVRVMLCPRPAKCPAPDAASATRWIVLVGKASATWSRRSRPRSGLLRPPLTHLSPWDVDLLLELNRDYILENFASPDAILVADPTGFAKKGTKSVGVQRQYSGTLGRIDNCQIATFLAYVAPDRDRVLLDRRLYLPKDSWLADPARCAEAGVPADTTFKTRPEQVIEMIDDARAAGVPFAWFTADEEFGQNKGLREHLQDAGTSYVMAVPKNTSYTDTETGREIQLQHVALKLHHTAWQRRACGIGTKGFRIYDWALIADADADHQYMIRRSIDDGELAFYHCYNPNRAGFGELVKVAGARWPIEECFGAAKNEVGLDEYQVRKYDAWYRHMTLAMFAHNFLAVTAYKAKKGDPLQSSSQ